jgi:5-hydroxyisourate hydrolase-like protein (transthyretin family)
MTYTYAPGAYTQPIVAGFTAQQVGDVLDTNHDGQVSQEELAKADTDHDGKVSASEVQQLVHPVAAYAHPATYVQPTVHSQPMTYTYAPGAYTQPIIAGFTAQQVGAALDTNHDGKVSQEELAKADTNHDGKVNASEVQQLVQPAHTVTYSQPVQSAGSFVAYPQYSYASGAYAQPVVPYGFTAQTVGAALDVNHDGKVSQEELKAADTNNVGNVDAAEVAATAPNKK